MVVRRCRRFRVRQSANGGLTFTTGAIPELTYCSGGSDFSRASDPWLTFAPDGTLYQMSLVETKVPSGGNTPTGMSVSRSDNGGMTWEDPTFIAYDTDTSLFNDKNTITADPTNSNYVYAIWDRLDSPPGKGSLKSSENTSGYRGPTLLARTTDGGETWEPARIIYNLGTHNQTIGNQIVVLPNGTLVNLFNLIRNDNKGKIRGYNVAVIRSSDKGVTWDSNATLVSNLQFVQVTDPDTGAAVRTGDIIPEVAVDPTTGALYAVWQDGRWANGAYSHVAFSQSLDGGRTWSQPTKIDNAPNNVSAFTPSVAVAANGTVGVAYYDFRNNDATTACPPTTGSRPVLLVALQQATGRKHTSKARSTWRTHPWPGGTSSGTTKGSQRRATTSGCCSPEAVQRPAPPTSSTPGSRPRHTGVPASTMRLQPLKGDRCRIVELTASTPSGTRSSSSAARDRAVVVRPVDLLRLRRGQIDRDSV